MYINLNYIGSAQENKDCINLFTDIIRHITHQKFLKEKDTYSSFYQCLFHAQPK